MLGSKLIRGISGAVGITLLILLFRLDFNQPVVTSAAIATPPPRDTPTPKPPPTAEPAPTKDKSPGASGAIEGQLIDQSTGQPGAGLEITFGGYIIRTDADGRFSLTGMEAGSYPVIIHLPDGSTAGQNIDIVHLADREKIAIDLAYHSQPLPSPTPANTATPMPTPTPASSSPSFVSRSTRGNDAAHFSPLLPFTGGETVIWINPNYINNEEGVAGHIALDVVNVNDFGAFQSTLHFNPKVIQIDNVVLGDFLESTGRTSIPLVVEIDNTTGEISFVAFSSGETAGPDGGGTLAVINFTSRQIGESDLILDQVVLVSRLGDIIEANVGHGYINVTTCFGDLNGDGVINVSDLQSVAGRTNQVLGDPNYVAEYDLDNNGVLDEGDLAMITDRLYEFCP